jgi:hypothetical protein
MILRMVAIRGSREIRMIEGYMRIERGKRVVCLSSFPLHDVYLFESSRLSDMSTAYL